MLLRPLSEDGQAVVDAVELRQMDAGNLSEPLLEQIVKPLVGSLSPLV